MNMRIAGVASASVLLLSGAVLFAQDDDYEVEETPISLVGCVQRETDYRQQNDSGRGGFLGFGGGLGDEYVLVHAARGTAGAPADCTTATGGEAFELTGSGEEDLEGFVGRRVSIHGTLKEAEVDAATGRPTGGRQAGDDLRLFEVEVESFRAIADVQRTDTLARAEPVQERVPQERDTLDQDRGRIDTSSAQDDRVTGVAVDADADVDQQLPRTASPLSVIGLLGLLSLGGVAGLRVWAARDRD